VRPQNHQQKYRETLLNIFAFVGVACLPVRLQNHQQTCRETLLNITVGVFAILNCKTQQRRIFLKTKNIELKKSKYL